MDILFQLETAAIPRVGSQCASADHVVDFSPSFFCKSKNSLLAASFPQKNAPIFWFLLVLGSPFSLFLPGHCCPNETSMLRNN
jgi:hypothetical protein